MQKEKTWNVILKRLLPHDYIVWLDEEGQQVISVDLAKKLEDWQRNISGRLIFCVGGSYGFAAEAKQKANWIWSLSMLTLSHQLVRIFAIEKMYKTHTILQRILYHHE